MAVTSPTPWAGCTALSPTWKFGRRGPAACARGHVGAAACRAAGRRPEAHARAGDWAGLAGEGGHRGGRAAAAGAPPASAGRGLPGARLSPAPSPAFFALDFAEEFAATCGPRGRCDSACGRARADGSIHGCVSRGRAGGATIGAAPASMTEPIWPVGQMCARLAGARGARTDCSGGSYDIRNGGARGVSNASRERDRV